jgi:hypothetical protein
MRTAAEIAMRLGGKRAKRLRVGWLTCCPVASHGRGAGDANPSLRLMDGETRLLVRCFAGCARADVLDALHQRGLLDARAGPRKAQSRFRTDESNKSLAISIWNEAWNPVGTPVEQHLSKRRVMLPPRCEAVRYHPRCPFGKDDDDRTAYTPAMLALVVGIVDNKPQAIHRTALDRKGSQVELAGCKRMTLGPIGGGAVKFTHDEDVTIALGIGEGLETTLSLQRLPEWQGSPVWSVLTEGGIAAFPLLSGIETLAVAVDSDKPGEKAARKVTARWRDAGRELLLFEAANRGDDLNDVLG